MTNEVSADASMFECVKDTMNSAWTSTTQFIDPATNKMSQLFEKTGLKSVGSGVYSLGNRTISLCKENPLPASIGIGALLTVGAVYAAYKTDMLPESIQSKFSWFQG